MYPNHLAISATIRTNYTPIIRAVCYDSVRYVVMESAGELRPNEYCVVVCL